MDKAKTILISSAITLALALIVAWKVLQPAHAQRVLTTDMVTIPAGPFTMGSDSGPGARMAASTPGGIVLRIAAGLSSMLDGMKLPP